MFTGIIQEVGTVARRGANSLTVRCFLRARPGDSVAVNGACLTVAKASRRGLLAFDVSEETWRATNLRSLRAGQPVNLEPALRAGDALGGHLVSGHVDARARILQLKRLPGGFALLKAELPRSLKRLVAPKGSVALDGVSLTVAAVRGACFEAALVPHTLSRTNLARRRAGESVNLEADLVARYVAAALGR